MPAEEPYHVLADGVRQDTATAMLQQSAALMALVAHLINQDTGLDFAGVSGGAATSSTKGTMRREKMQQDLAARKSSFFPAGSAEDFQKASPIEAPAEDRGRACGLYLPCLPTWNDMVVTRGRRRQGCACG